MVLLMYNELKQL